MIHGGRLSLPSPTRISILTHYCAVIVGIDGYSRLVTYLHCSDNNCASTFLDLFLEACHTYNNIPSRVRCDHGTDVTRCMIETRP